MDSIRPWSLTLAIAVLHLAAGAQAQSVDRILDSHIGAAGGRKALEQIVGTARTGTATAPDGRSGVFRDDVRQPDSLYIGLTWDDRRWSTAFNGRSAWQDDDRDGRRTLTGDAAARVRVDAFHATDRLLAFARAGHVVASDEARINGRPVTVVAVRTVEGFERRLFFDTAHHLLVKDEFETGAGVEVRLLDDYRRVGTVMEPHLIEWRRNGETLRIVIDRVTHNVAPEARPFDYDREREDPPLRVPDLLGAMVRAADTVAAARSSYAVTKTRTSKRLDGRGQPSGAESASVADEFYLDGRPVEALVASNGRPLSERDRRREVERVERIVQEHVKGRARPGPPFDALLLSRRLQVHEFTNPRREHVSGRAAIVVDFHPKARVKPANQVETILSRQAGVLWIDEQTHQVMRMESYVLEDFHFVPGITHFRGSSSVTEQTLIDEVWLPSFAQDRIISRGVVGGRHYQHMTTRYSDYRKFEVETEFQVALPDAQ